MTPHASETTEACAACGDGSGSYTWLIGVPMCPDCRIEWYDGDRPGAGTDAANTPESIGGWVREQRRAALTKGLPHA